ncbi:MAG: aldehyde ferredoxin oxidoreductase N-terminal domain-containing protein [Dehalococcoidales bacterium]
MGEFGYAGKILITDLSDGKSTEIATSGYSDRFIGGRGIAAKLFWDMVPTRAGAFDPENCLIYATGPVTGFMGLAGSRWVICGKSPIHNPEAFSYGNLGGKWGPALKQAGYDALAVKGQAEKPAYLYIHDGTVEMKDASALWGLSAFATAEMIREELGKGVSILSIGPAAENRVVYATALADGGASVSGGIGSVMGSKNLKAIAVAGNRRLQAAHPEKLEQIKKLVKQIRGSTFDAPSPWVVPGLTVQENCYGCGVGCSRQSYRGENGRRFKSFCQAATVYREEAMDYFGEWNEVPLMATRLCDAHGLDAAVIAPLISWLVACYSQGLVNEEQTGLPLSRAGSVEFIEELTRKIAFREGFGDVLASGTLAAAETLGEKAKELATKFVATGTNENKDYDPRLILTTALLLATEPRKPVSQLHGISGNTLISWTSWAEGAKDSFFSTDDLRTVADRFWGGNKAVDFSTYEGKALAAKKVQDRSYAQESLILCDVHWPMNVTSSENPDGHVGNPALESQIYSIITGRETGEEELCRTGERIFNLQRAILLRQGWGGRNGDRILDYYFTHPLEEGEVFFNRDAIMPGPDGKIISRLGTVLDRNEFEEMKSEYYRLRGWDVETGFPTRTRLIALGLSDIIGDLQKRGLVV